MNVPTEILRCPVHGIPDCSPLLNGCSIPNRLGAAYEAGRDEVKRRVEAQIRHTLAVPADVTTVDRELMVTDLRLNVLDP